MATTGKLRMMLVDDSAETREYLRKLLQFESHIEIVGMAANGREAVELAVSEKPDLILMDINMPVMDGITAAGQIFRKLPAVRVVMMSVQSEMAYLRRAMQVGAREFLIKPFTHDELLNILGEVSSLKPSPAEAVARAPAPAQAARRSQMVKQATLVSVFSPRGGAGCSTLAINLGIALQGQRKAQVLLLDGNLRFGALDVMLNLQISRNITDILPSLADAEPDLLHSATIPHSAGIRLLAAPPSPEMADMVAVEHVERIMDLARRRYDYVVVDLGSSLDDRALSIMDASDTVFVLLTPDIPAIKNVRLFMIVAEGLGYETEKMQIVLNKAQPRGGIDAAAIERHMKRSIAATIPDSPRVAQAAINRGVPLIIYEREVHKEMPVTRRLLTLVDAVPPPGEAVAGAMPAQREDGRAERAPASPPEPEKQKRGLFGKLFRRD